MGSIFFGPWAALRSLAQLIHREIDVDLARQALGKNKADSHRGVTGVERILEVVCQHYDVRVSDLQGRKRTQSIALPRQVAPCHNRRKIPTVFRGNTLRLRRR